MLNKKIGLLCLTVVLAVCLVAAEGVGQWKDEAWQRIPEEVKTWIVTRDYQGRQALSVMCFSGTEQTWGKFSSSANIGTLVDICDVYFSGSKFLVVAVCPYGTARYWYPWQIAFTQGITQFNVGVYGNEYSSELVVSTMMAGHGYFPLIPLWDYISMKSAFSGGSLKPDTQAWGAIRIPSGIDLTLPFKVWVNDEDFGIIEAFYGRG